MNRATAQTSGVATQHGVVSPLATQTVRTHRRCQGPQQPREIVDRRSLLQGSLSMALVVGSATQASPARALDLSELITQAFPPPPQPVMFPRKALDQRFAVLLMRAGYEGMDALDFMATDKFQIAFWKLRASEQEGYNLQYSPLKVRLGDLTDPLYFDFISYSQFAVIGREMPRGQQVFQEYCEVCEDRQYSVIRRNPALADNSQLPVYFYDFVGDFIYTGMRDGFRGEVFGAPKPLPATATGREVAAAAQELLNTMVSKGFALKAEVEEVADDSFKVVVTGPATLWGQSSLAFRRSPVVTCYSTLAVCGLLRASGLWPRGQLPPASVITETGTETLIQWGSGSAGGRGEVGEA